MKRHELYVSSDFKHLNGEDYEDNVVAIAVVEGGLDVCKICGEFEAGLDNPCK